jgi:ADP-ribose pyrophosphatase YjhB (NUDIX family)
MTGHPRVRVAALLRRGDAVLLLRQEKPGQRYWLLPGGGVEEGETLEQALRRELREECDIEVVQLDGPIAIAESISPPELRPRKHVIHVIFHAVAGDEAFEHVNSADAAIRGHRLLHPGELDGIAVHPPIHRFLERWQPGDPFIHLGQLWAR